MFSIFLVFSICSLKTIQGSFAPYFSSDIEITSRVTSIGNPPISISENGYLIVVWSLHSISNYGIFGQFYDQNGYPVDETFQISTSVTNSPDYPSVSMQNDGTSLVVWQGENQDDDGSWIYGQLLSMNQKIGNEFKVNNITTGDQQKPCIAASNGYFIVIWQGPDNDQEGIYGKIFNINGDVVYEDFLINENQTNTQSDPSVDIFASIDDNLIVNLYFVVTWMSYDINFQILAREFLIKLDGNNTTNFGNEFQVNENSSLNNTFPKISLISQDNDILYIIIWQADSVKARIFSNNGRKDNEIIVNTRENMSPYFYPSVCLTMNYGFYVVYQMNSFDGSGLDIYVKSFSFLDETIGEEDLLNINVIGDQQLPFVKTISNGEVFVVWLSANFENSGNALDFQIQIPSLVTYSQINNGSQNIIPNLNISSSVDFIFKIEENTNYYYFLWQNQGENIRIDIYDSLKNATVSNWTWVNSSLFDSFDFGFWETTFILVWSQDNEIYAQPNTTNQAIKVNEIYNGSNAKVLGFDDKSFLVVWTCYSEQTNSSAICGRFYDSSLQAHDQFFVSSDLTNLNQSIDNASLFSADQETIIVVWVCKNLYTSDEIKGIWLNISENSVQVSSPIFSIYRNESVYIHLNGKVKIVVDANTYYCFVVWEELLQGFIEPFLHGQIVDLSGNKMSPLIEISNFPDFNQISPSVDFDSLFFVVWAAYGQDTSGFGIFLKISIFSATKLMICLE